MQKQPKTYMSAQQLAERIQYDVRTIRERLKDSVLLEGLHYVRPFGGRKILFIWEAVEAELLKCSAMPHAAPRAAKGR